MLYLILSKIKNAFSSVFWCLLRSRVQVETKEESLKICAAELFPAYFLIHVMYINEHIEIVIISLGYPSFYLSEIIVSWIPQYQVVE